MRARILRLLLLTILVAAGLSSVAWTWALAQDVTQLETTGKQSAARIDRLEAALDQFAHDELIYVASGQIDTETLTATSNLSQQLVSESAWLLGGLAAGAAPSAGAVAEAVASLADVDGRARENIQAGLDLMAADLLFTETTRTRQLLREQLRALRLAESNAVADARATDLKQAWMALASVAILFAWGLVRSARRPASEAPANVTPQATEPEPVALNVVPRPDPRPDPVDRSPGDSGALHRDQSPAVGRRSSASSLASVHASQRLWCRRLDGRRRGNVPGGMARL